MALTLTVADNGDGTGGTATIAGADNATVTVYTAPVQSGNAPPAWTSTGTRTGNGTVSLAVSPAVFYAYALGQVSGSPQASVPLLFTASRTNTSTYDKIKDGVVAQLQTLTFSGLSTPPGTLSADRIVRFPKLRGDVLATYGTYPLIAVTTEGQETFPGGTNARDDIGYPVTVTILDRVSPRELDREDTYLRWRAQISAALRNQRLSGVTEPFLATIEPAPILNWIPDKDEWLYSALTVRYTTREARGVI